MQATRRNFKLAVAARMQYRTSQRQNQINQHNLAISSIEMLSKALEHIHNFNPLMQETAEAFVKKAAAEIMECVGTLEGHIFIMEGAFPVSKL
ncbi:hypothetical protein V6Z11_D01G104100 [Gossypium hirsutum]